MFPLQDERGQAIQVTYYPDLTPIITARHRVETLLLRPTNLSEFVAAMFWCDAQRTRGVPVKHLVLPFMPGARQDRMNTTGDALFALKSFAEMVNARSFETVSILDPHSDVAPALLDRVKVWDVRDVAEGFVANQQTAHAYDAVIAPDAGAAKRAGLLAGVLNIPTIQAGKTRSLTDGALAEYNLPPLSNAKRYLIVDDICDGGATFLALRNAAPDAVIDLYVTHGLFSRGTAQLLHVFGRIYCSDSIITTRQHGVTILPICERMANV